MPSPSRLVLVCCATPLVAVLACSTSDAPPAESAATRRLSAEEDCVRDSTAHHEDPVALVEEFVRREAEGPMEREDVAARWVAGAVTCAVQPSADPYVVITSVRVRPLRHTNHTAAVLVERTRSHTLAPDSTGTMERLVKAPAAIVDTVQVIRTRHGWRIAHLPPGAYRLPGRTVGERTALTPEARATLHALARASGR